ncbi:hypothetical protein HanIR_Chr17g0890991 [Helianthus annuus]|nr:hypothetical protein HanIR_Chr17g0890991 [Helianthus annuus]
MVLNYEWNDPTVRLIGCIMNGEETTRYWVRCLNFEICNCSIDHGRVCVL